MDDSTNELARVKGLVINSVCATLKKLHGERMFEDTLAALPEEIASAIRDGRVMVSNLYPVTWLTEIYRCAREVSGRGLDLPREIGSVAARDDVNAIFRFLLKTLPIQTTSAKGAAFFKKYFTCPAGTIEIEVGDVERQERWTCKGWLGFDANLWNDLMGSAEATLELVGAKLPRARIISGGEDDQVVFELSWS